MDRYREGVSDQHNLTQDRLKKLMSYNPGTGVFTWKESRGSISSGQIAGSKHSKGYLVARIDGTLYFLHRLAFLYMTGSHPPELTDHINGSRDENQWDNLRAVDAGENNKNVKKRSDNSSGLQGVSWAKKAGSWHVYINEKMGRTNLCHTPDFFEACCVRKSAELAYGFHANHGRAA